MRILHPTNHSALLPLVIGLLLSFTVDQKVLAQWTQIGDDIDGEAAGDYSGRSVALSSTGNRVAIGAPRNSGNGSWAGHVRVFDWNGTTWIQVGNDIDGEAAGDLSGSSIALSSDGNRLVIGAPANNTFAGHVRVYDWDGVDWTQTGADIDGDAENDWAGESVALSSDGSRLAVAIVGNDGGGVGAGCVRVYDWDGFNWVPTGGNLYGERASDGFGASVSLSSDGNHLAVGATDNSDSGDHVGSVRVYYLWEDRWLQVGADIDGKDPSELSGYSVALSSDGRILAIGAHYNSGITGSVRVYTW